MYAAVRVTTAIARQVESQIIVDKLPKICHLDRMKKETSFPPPEPVSIDGSHSDTQLVTPKQKVPEIVMSTDKLDALKVAGQTVGICSQNVTDD